MAPYLYSRRRRDLLAGSPMALRTQDPEATAHDVGGNVTAPSL
jgi:hypothetical protein